MTGKSFGGHALGSYNTLTVGVEGGVLIVDDREFKRYSGVRNDSVGGVKRALSMPVPERVLEVRVYERKKTIKVESRRTLIH